MSEDLPLFVYGTLRSDGPMARLVGSGARRRATVRGRLWQMPAGYPALELGGTDLVYGELTPPIDPARLAALDAFEGVDEGLYVRRLLSADGGDGRMILAWAWVMPDPRRHGARPLKGGRWRAPLGGIRAD